LLVVKRSELNDVPFTATVDVKMDVEQLVSDGPNNLKVIDPVGLAPPFKLTFAKTWRPTMVDVDAVIIICGVERPCADAAAGNAPMATLTPAANTTRTEAVGTGDRRCRARTAVRTLDFTTPTPSRHLMIAMTPFRTFLILRHARLDLEDEPPSSDREHHAEMTPLSHIARNRI
jgi:hypothetical protein